MIPLPGPSPRRTVEDHLDTIARALATLDALSETEAGYWRARCRRLADRVGELSRALAELVDRGVPIPAFEARNHGR